MFGILNLGYWNLFEIWILVLGILLILKTSLILYNIDWLQD